MPDSSIMSLDVSLIAHIKDYENVYEALSAGQRVRKMEPVPDKIKYIYAEAKEKE